MDNGRHQVQASQLVLAGEDVDDFLRLRNDLNAEIKPSGVLAEFLVDRAANIIWRLRRAAIFEAGFFTWISHQQSQAYDGKGAIFGHLFLAAGVNELPPENQGRGKAGRKRQSRKAIGRTLDAALRSSDPLGKIGRYENHLMRQLTWTFEELRRLPKEAGKLSVADVEGETNPNGEQNLQKGP